MTFNIFQNKECIEHLISFQKNGTPLYIKMLNEELNSMGLIYAENKKIVNNFFHKMTFNQLKNIIKYIPNIRFSIYQNIVDICANYNHFEYIKWLYKYTSFRGTKNGVLNGIIYFNRKDMIDWIINNNITFIENNNTVDDYFINYPIDILEYSIFMGRYYIFKCLIKKMDFKPSKLSLNYAIAYKRDKMIKYILKKYNILPNKYTCSLTQWNGNIDLFYYYKNFDIDINPKLIRKYFIAACKKGNIDYMIWIVKENPDIYFPFPLYELLKHRHYKVIKMMVKNPLFSSIITDTNLSMYYFKLKRNITIYDVKIIKLLYKKKISIFECLFNDPWENENELLNYLEFIYNNNNDFFKNICYLHHIVNTESLNAVKWYFKNVETKNYRYSLSKAISLNCNHIVKYLLKNDKVNITFNDIRTSLIRENITSFKLILKKYDDIESFFKSKDNLYILYKCTNPSFIHILRNKNIHINYYYILNRSLIINNIKMIKWFFKNYPLLFIPSSLYLSMVKKSKIKVFKSWIKHVDYDNIRILYLVGLVIKYGRLDVYNLLLESFPDFVNEFKCLPYQYKLMSSIYNYNRYIENLTKKKYMI